jgi:hypothetical protein
MDKKTNSIYANESGYYSVIVETELGCLGYDTVLVEGIDILEEIAYSDTVDFGKVYWDNTVKLNVNLNNSLAKTIYLSSNFNGNINRFEVDESKSLEFSFKPTEIGEYINKIEFIVEQPCVDTFYVYIVGSVYTRVTLELPKVIAYPGDQVSIPIKLYSNINIDANYNFDMDYVSEVINFEKEYNPMSFTNSLNLYGAEQIIENPSGTILLTDLAEKPLTVDSLFWNNEFIESEVIDGWIRLDTICTHEYRVVNIDYTNINAFYDVSKDKLIIQKIGNSNSSDFKIKITNLNGSLVLNNTLEVTDYKELDLSGLANGVYFVEIRKDGLSNLYKFIKLH